MKLIIRLLDKLTARAPSWVRAGIRRAVVAGITAFASYAISGAADAPSWVVPLLTALGLGAGKARRDRVR